jgi:hypothetical protein
MEDFRRPAIPGSLERAYSMPAPIARTCLERTEFRSTEGMVIIGDNALSRVFPKEPFHED